MKKILAALSVVTVLSLGMVGALAVLPHAHGSDLDHSAHQSCPIYQFGLQNVHADFTAALVFSLVFVLFLVLDVHKKFVICNTHSSSFLRAPPLSI